MAVMRLYPAQHEELALEGLYLGMGLHRQAATDDMLIYANYVVSLDGRIALKNAGTGEYEVPAAIANKRDWRLYQELAAQADVLITSARYFRQLEKGYAQDLLPIGGEPEYADLLDWRISEGLKPQPAIAILSASLEIPSGTLNAMQDREVFVLTTSQCDAPRRAEIEAHGAQVIEAGEQAVDGRTLRQHLIRLGFSSAYMIAGPGVHRTLLSAGCLDHLFLTISQQTIGGDDYHSLVSGPLLTPPENFALASLYYDSHPDHPQMFAHFRKM